MNKDIDHIDIVVTHKCMNHCPFCIDKFVHSSKEVVKPMSVAAFLEKVRTVTDKQLEVLFLGGEPTCAPLLSLAELTRIVRYYGFSPIISTNNPNKNIVANITELFDWVQVTVHNDSQIEFYRNYRDRINIKMSGDKTFTIDRLHHFIEVTKDFKRRSVSMYFAPDFKELCEDQRVWQLLDTLEWKRNGSYLYTFYKGVRFKRCIPGETNIIDEPTVPKLYPNGNYNKTWLNEDMDDYLK